MRLLPAARQLWISSASLSSRQLMGGGTSWTATAFPRRVHLPTTFTALAMSTTTTDDDALRHVKSYQLTGETTAGNPSGLTAHTHAGHTLQTDVPRKMGGQDTAPQPVEMLLAAWMGCTQATALFVGRQMKPQRIVLERLVFDVSAQRDARGALALPIHQDPVVPSRLQRIRGTITVYRADGHGLSQEQMNILHEQTELRCPVANMMIASGCQINVEWIDGNADPLV